MPSTAWSSGCKRRMIAEASDRRSSRGFKLIWIRPVLGVMLVPSTPMNDDRLDTSGSLRMTLANACCRSLIAANDTTAGASEMPRMTPVSCTGKKPLGTRIASTMVKASVATVTTSVAGWCCSTHWSVRP